MNEVETKLAAARTRLILDKPFLGALVLRLPLREANGSWCDTSATDARSIYYSPGYIEPLSLGQVQFVLAHEALHCGLSHFARREHRDLNRWNIACDHAVNPLLVEDGLELPPGALYNEDYTGLSAEEIYPLIKSDTDEETLDKHLYDSPDRSKSDESFDNDCNQDQEKNSESPTPESPGPESDEPAQRQPEQQPEQQQQRQSNQKSDQSRDQEAEHEQQKKQKQDPAGTPAQMSNHKSNGIEFEHTHSSSGSALQAPLPLSAQEKVQLNTQWQQRLVGAAQQASQAGKMNGSVARLIERLLRSTVPWRTLLARYMSGSSRTDYNIMRPSQRRTGEAILPSLHTRQTNIVIALDTSGSIEQDELAVFIAEVNAIKSLVNAKITLLACDWQLDEEGPWVFEPWEHLTLPRTLQGGGGTDFSPVFDWMHSNPIQADLVIYFTDAQGRFPSRPSGTETLWLVKGSAEVPWGQRIQLN